MLTKLQKKLAEIRENEERGMSLTELVVVVAILAILVAIAVPVYLSIQDDARNQSVKTTLSNALTLYHYEDGRPGGDGAAAIGNLNNSAADGISVALNAGATCIAAGYGATGADNQHNVVIDTGVISTGACS